MWNIAHNLGGFGAPLLAGSAARSFGWKWGKLILPVPDMPAVTQPEPVVHVERSLLGVITSQKSLAWASSLASSF